MTPSRVLPVPMAPIMLSPRQRSPARRPQVELLGCGRLKRPGGLITGNELRHFAGEIGIDGFKGRAPTTCACGRRARPCRWRRRIPSPSDR